MFLLFFFAGINGGSNLYKGPVDCIRSIYHSHGIRGCFRGLNATILREIPGFSMYIASYEVLCDKLTPSGRDGPGFLLMLGAGGIAGMLSWLVNIPIDVVKSRIQSDDLSKPKYNGVIDCFVKSYRAEGLKVFWRGLPIICIRAFPTNAVTLAVYSSTYNSMKEFYGEKSRYSNSEALSY